MHVPSQAKLLKVIESKRFKRLGGTTDQFVDIRIIAATNRDLEAAVKEGNFREDLYYRLNVIPILLPPLRERHEDIPLLLQHYMTKYSGEFHKVFSRISEDALQMLTAYAWPGNVRELKNLVERILILEKGDTIVPEHLPSEITASHATHPEVRYCLPATGIRLDEVEKEFVRQALETATGNQTRAAQLLGISRDQLRYRMQKFGFAG